MTRHRGGEPLSRPELLQVGRLAREKRKAGLNCFKPAASEPEAMCDLGAPTKEVYASGARIADGQTASTCKYDPIQGMRTVKKTTTAPHTHPLRGSVGTSEGDGGEISPL